MRIAQKIRREMLRLLNPMHFWEQGRFWSTVLWARMVHTPAFTDMSADVPKLMADDHLIGFVVYSPEGIRADTRNTLKSLQGLRNVKILVLVNHDVTPSDLDFFTETGLAHRARKNTGYDFGAYRDLVLSLEGQTFRRLTLMNDSFIFPIHGTIAEMIAGLETSPFTGLSEQGERKVKTRHVCSFCLSFDKTVFTQSIFQKFWRGYSPQIDRRYTIKAGEISLSQYLIRNGIQSKVMYEKTGLVENFKGVSDVYLNQIITTLKYSEVLDANESVKLKALTPEVKRELLKTYLQNTENLRLSPVYTLVMKMPFIKRRNLQIYPDLAQWYAKNYGIDPAV